jgi:SAM-dependent methyltransferase
MSGDHVPQGDSSKGGAWASAPETTVDVLGHRLVIKQNIKPVRSVSSVGFTCWAASILLSHLLRPNEEDSDNPSSSGESSEIAVLRGLTQHKRILELGSGCGGIAGIAALLFGAAHVTFSDRSDILPFCEENVVRNVASVLPEGGGEKRVDFLELVWDETDVSQLRGKYDLVLGADVVYHGKLVAPLLRTIYSICGPDTPCCLAFEHHDGEALRAFNKFAPRLFTVDKFELPDSDLRSDPRYEHALMSVVLLRPLPQDSTEALSDGSVSEDSWSDSFDADEFL